MPTHVAYQVAPIPAAQVFISDPALAIGEAARSEEETPAAPNAVRLIQAMANDKTIDGFEIRQSSAFAAQAGDLELQPIASYHLSSHPAGPALSMR